MVGTKGELKTAENDLFESDRPGNRGSLQFGFIDESAASQQLRNRSRVCGSIEGPGQVGDDRRFGKVLAWSQSYGESGSQPQDCTWWCFGSDGVNQIREGVCHGAGWGSLGRSLEVEIGFGAADRPDMKG